MSRSTLSYGLLCLYSFFFFFLAPNDLPLVVVYSLPFVAYAAGLAEGRTC